MNNLFSCFIPAVPLYQFVFLHEDLFLLGFSLHFSFPKFPLQKIVTYQQPIVVAIAKLAIKKKKSLRVIKSAHPFDNPPTCECVRISPFQISRQFSHPSFYISSHYNTPPTIHKLRLKNLTTLFNGKAQYREIFDMSWFFHE